MPDSQEKEVLFAVETDSFAALNGQPSLSLPEGRWIRFNLASGGHWYGHGFSHDQPFPLETGSIVNEAFAVNNIQSPLWMCSAGMAILAETNAVLKVRLNAENNGLLEILCPGEPLVLRFFYGSNLREAQQKAMAHLGWPNRVPEKSYFGDSIFCTWTQYPRCITQTRILDTARQIRKQGYPCSTITIDDRWESSFGELAFSKDFPDPKAMMAELHAMGFKVLLWVTPFINQEAGTHGFLSEKGFLVRHKAEKGPALLKWWGGTAGLVDLTNPAAREWYKAQLLRLKNEIGVDGFKIDGGDAKYQPAIALSQWTDYKGASGYLDELLALFEEIAPGVCESRTAWLSQKRNILWREGGKDSHWGRDNGLAAMVNLGLHLSLMGYDILIPDMIPGRVQTMVSTMALPTDELFIRWTEASVFFPIVQFSYFPWNYSGPVADIALKYAKLHKALEDYLYERAKSRKAPLMRPLSYDEPGTEVFHNVADEFLLGPDLLIAPVLQSGQSRKNILLPKGEWQDAWTGKVYEKPVLKGYPTPCPGIPIFIRPENRKLCKSVHEILKTIQQDSIRPGVTTSTYYSGLDRDLSVTG